MLLRSAGGNRQPRRRNNRFGRTQEDFRDAILKAFEKDEENQLGESTQFKALKRGPKTSYQAQEKTQYPAPTFPSTLASYALVFATDDEWKEELNAGSADRDQTQKSFAKLNAQPLLDKMRSADMIVRQIVSEDQEFMFALISISEKRQKQVAEIMSLPPHNLIRLRMKAEDDEGQEVKRQGAWYPFKQHLAHLYEKSSEDTLFSSRQQCQIIEFLLNGDDEKAMGPQLVQREACEPGYTPLEQLKKDERILDYFYLHHEKKKQWMLKYWAGSFATKQPHEDIREYLGEDIGLVFVYIGFLLTSMWVPAIVGLFVIFMDFTALAETGGASSDNPYYPLYAIFMAVWAIHFRATWGRLQQAYQLEWGIENYEEDEQDRREFINNPKTYKRLNRITQSEEYYADPILRNLFLALSFCGVVAMIAVSIFVHVSIEAAKSGIAQWIGWGPDAVLPKVMSCLLQAGSVLGLRFVAEVVFTKLCEWENWQTEAEYEAAMITKKFCFGCVNSYFPIYFVGFMANHIQPFGVDVSCHEEQCLDYMTMMIAIIYITNVLTRYFLTYWYPSLMRSYTKWKQDMDAKGDGQVAPEENKDDDADEDDEGGDGSADDKQIVLREYYLDNFEGVEPSLTEKFFHLGYVMFFGAAFPALTFLALINNILDLRQLAKYVMTGSRRPSYKCAKDLGAWLIILDIFVIMSIVSQSCFLAFTSNGLYYYFPGMNEVQKTFYAVVIEHLLLLLKVLVDGHYSELPAEVKDVFEDRTEQCKAVIEEYDHFKPEENVIFYTDDEGNVDLGKENPLKGPGLPSKK